MGLGPWAWLPSTTQAQWRAEPFYLQAGDWETADVPGTSPCLLLPHSWGELSPNLFMQYIDPSCCAPWPGCTGKDGGARGCVGGDPFQRGKCCQVLSYTRGTSKAAWQGWEMLGKTGMCKMHIPMCVWGVCTKQGPLRDHLLIVSLRTLWCTSPIPPLSICLPLCLCPHPCPSLISVFVTVYISVCLWLC